jgi:hypothetical protein
MRERSPLPGWMVCVIASISFAAGSLATAHLTRATPAQADGERVFELNVYHAVRGRVPALESRFRDAARLLAKHDIQAVGYWVPDDDPAWNDTFVYLVAHASRDAAKRNWDAFHADPAFQEFVKSEQADKLIESVDRTYMRPTAFSSTR